MAPGKCSGIVLRRDAVLLVHRPFNGPGDRTLPGGTPRRGESMAACARRELLEEAGLSADPARVAPRASAGTAPYLGNLWRPAGAIARRPNLSRPGLRRRRKHAVSGRTR